MRTTWASNLGPAIVCLAALLFAPPAARGEELLYETHIEPVLQARCARCHGPQKHQGGLDLSHAATLLAGSESGPVLAPGRPDASLLYEKIASGEMPPEDQPPLTPEQTELVRRWIAGGARFRDPPARREITEREVTPVLLLRCAVCHGHRRREAELDVRSAASLLRGGKSGPAVVPGNPAQSLLLQRIHAGEMPPRRQLVEVSVKPMEAAEIELLERWIAAGLPRAPDPPDVASAAPDPLVGDQDRRFWAFQPPANVRLPAVAAGNELHSPIDAFVLRRLRAAGLGFAPEADRATLVRRLYFDLLGLPPEPADVEAFVADRRPRAYERLIERLLASPRYGERWGRHWLDVAGYADSEGAQNEDRVRPHIWRYRDYVIRAFNADKPYDRFLHEQLAGDELADYRSADAITPELYDNLVATGFLRTAPDRTFAGITNFVPDRLEVIADEIQILGSAVLGLTVQCARCHTHKFDPIPQRDYYRLAAALKDALDEHDWLKPEQRTLPHVLPDERAAWEQHERQLDEKIEPLRRQIEAAKDQAQRKQLEEHLRQLEAQRRPEPRVRALWSRGEPSPTYLLRRGNYLTPGYEVGPGVPSVLADGRTPFTCSPPWPGAAATGRRLALARWLTEPDHPLTARVLVNRVWKHHFGRGLVATLDNFGTAGARPTHPELLDWLATQVVRRGWSIKALHREILASRTYRQTSDVDPQRAARDPQGELLSRMPLARMDAEVLRDTLLALAGQLDATPGGPPDAVDERPDGLVTPRRTARGWRRSIYVLQRRTKIPTLLESFDYPQMGPNCVERDESIVAPQALHLLNNALVYELAEHFAERVRRQAGERRADCVQLAHRLAWGRAPTTAERALAAETLDRLERDWQAAAIAGEDPPDRAEAARRALVNYCHALMNSAALIYID